jgi:hypothetical protein
MTMSMFPNLVDESPERVKAWARQLVQVLERSHIAMGGGVATLATGTGQTVVSDQIIAKGATVLLTAATANAAAALATTFIPQATVLQGNFTINHASATTDDRTFFYTVIEPDADPVAQGA